MTSRSWVFALLGSLIKSVALAGYIILLSHPQWLYTTWRTCLTDFPGQRLQRSNQHFMLHGRIALQDFCSSRLVPLSKHQVLEILRFWIVRGVRGNLRYSLISTFLQRSLRCSTRRVPYTNPKCRCLAGKQESCHLRPQYRTHQRKHSKPSGTFPTHLFAHSLLVEANAVQAPHFVDFSHNVILYGWGTF